MMDIILYWNEMELKEQGGYNGNHRIFRSPEKTCAAAWLSWTVSSEFPPSETPGKHKQLLWAAATKTENRQSPGFVTETESLVDRWTQTESGLTLPGWTISCWPLRLYWICISFWKLSWQQKRKMSKEMWPKTTKHGCRRSLTPCFMMSLAWLATSFTILRAAEGRRENRSLMCVQKKRKHWFHPLTSHFVCLCSPLSLLEGSLDSLWEQTDFSFNIFKHFCSKKTQQEWMNRRFSSALFWKAEGYLKAFSSIFWNTASRKVQFCIFFSHLSVN